MAEIDPELALRSIKKAIEERGGNHYPDEKLIQYLARRNSYYTQADFVDSVSYAFRIIDLVNKNVKGFGESSQALAKHVTAVIKYEVRSNVSRRAKFDDIMEVLRCYKSDREEEGDYSSKLPDWEFMDEFEKEVRTRLSNERLIIWGMIAAAVYVVANTLFPDVYFFARTPVNLVNLAIGALIGVVLTKRL